MWSPATTRFAKSLRDSCFPGGGTPQTLRKSAEHALGDRASCWLFADIWSSPLGRTIDASAVTAVGDKSSSSTDPRATRPLPKTPARADTPSY